MYGPRSAYDSQTLAEHDRYMAERIFEDKLLTALRSKKVIEAIADAILQKESK